MIPILILLSLTLTPAATTPNAVTPSLQEHLAEIQSCRACHLEIVDSFIKTAHFNTSKLADELSIKGKFLEGRNILRTRVETTYFKMEKRRDGFFQTGYEKIDSEIKSRTERFDLIIGSGRKGQSYLYWKRNLLFQLPVSYLTGLDQWVNSPGYVDGQLNFDRTIPPRCLECHATFFELEFGNKSAEYAGNYRLGVSCERCHGPGALHVQHHSVNPGTTSPKYILNPTNFPLARKLDGCGLCHSGLRSPIRPAFSYRPGENLEKYLAPESSSENLRPDVHGNQVSLLMKSKCFQSRTDMSCSTCHNVHRMERDIFELSKKCMQCHQPRNCGMFTKLGRSIENNCIDCHMPNRKSNVIRINIGMVAFSPEYRNHAIGIYQSETAKMIKLLQRLK